jgi:2-C-methyl-D-erythritol 2,4-cyclodiphosphate synthase
VSGARVGFGYDIHRLTPGRPLFLGGIRFDFDRGLLGHSDGDVAAHALADALLSAAGAGDLGTNFPPGDPAWAGAAGAVILHETSRKLAAHGATLTHADITVVAEAPKIAPHVPQMRQALADALGVPPERVSIKGRTNEGLGEIGRGEAIAAYAVALIEISTR